MLNIALLNCDEKQEKKVNEPKSETIPNEKAGADKEFLLEEDGIRISLPSNFERYSAVKYQNKLKKNTKGPELLYEEERFAQVRNTEGNVYIYYNDTDDTSYFINTLPNLAMDNADPQSLLNMVRGKHSEIEEVSNRKYTKVTAKFNETPTAKIFKSIYKVTAPDLKEDLWAHSYLINANDKTVLININTKEEQDFDPYIQRMNF